MTNMMLFMGDGITGVHGIIYAKRDYKSRPYDDTGCWWVGGPDGFYTEWDVYTERGFMPNGMFIPNGIINRAPTMIQGVGGLVGRMFFIPNGLFIPNGIINRAP